jgi:hypothetical protein
MKTIKTFVVLMVLWPTATLLNSCSNCDKLEDAFALADLVFRTTDAIVGEVKSETPQESVWDLASFWTNEAEKVRKMTCCQETQPTTDYEKEINVYYKENASDPWGSPIQKEEDPHGAIGPCTPVNSQDEFSFTKNGLYLVEYILDVYNKTKERNENNNIDEFGGKSPMRQFEDNAVFGNNRAFMVIEVKSIDAEKSDKVDPYEAVSIRHLK